MYILKTSIRHIIILFVFIFFAGCESNKKISTTGPNKDQVSSTYISGTVSEIQKGKDGYTAKITTVDNKNYYVTISRSNLKDPQQYKLAKPGDTIIVKGDLWKMENQNHITVRELQ